MCNKNFSFQKQPKIEKLTVPSQDLVAWLVTNVRKFESKSPVPDEIL